VVIVQMTVMRNIPTLVLARLVNIVTYIITMEDTAKEWTILAGSPHQRSHDSLQNTQPRYNGNKAGDALHSDRSAQSKHARGMPSDSFVADLVFMML
jgi:hypothetical protein